MYCLWVRSLLMDSKLAVNTLNVMRQWKGELEYAVISPCCGDNYYCTNFAVYLQPTQF